MGTYILLVNSTDQGAKGVREIPNRQQASRDTAAKLGIVRKNVYMKPRPHPASVRRAAELMRNQRTPRDIGAECGQSC